VNAQQPATFVAYIRVSTEKQGRSGLGLEAQKETIAAFLRARPGSRLLVPEFVEVESGKDDTRPQLAAALERCRKTGATLLIAKLDRLSRNAKFLLTIVEASGEAGVAFCDLPNLPQGPVGKFMLTQMAAVAELEAGLISQRTKAALAAAKARGKTLGRPPETLVPATAESRQKGAEKAAEVRRAAADRAAYNVAPRIAELQAQGLSLAEVAKALTAEGFRTPRGAEWTATAVRRAALRAAE
jgi:DNA invertase Pin-like site-specific DNA recombinase